MLPQAAGMSCYSVVEEIMPGSADFVVELRGFEPMAIAGRWEISSYSSLRESMRAGGAAKDTCSRSWLRSKRPVTRRQRFVCVLTQAAS